MNMKLNDGLTNNQRLYQRRIERRMCCRCGRINDNAVLKNCSTCVTRERERAKSYYAKKKACNNPTDSIK